MSTENKRSLSDTDIEKTASELVDFIKDSENKDAFVNAFISAYKAKENASIEELKARLANEKEVDNAKMADYHTAGNIAPILSPVLNMHESERYFSRAISSSKRNLDKTIEERVEEINRLLAGVGGFSSQLRSCFTRSTVVFYEQDDPINNYRERLIFSINLPHFELISTEKSKDESGRTETQVAWDDAVNALARIIESSGLKAKYCKNDRNYGQFVMKQDLRTSTTLPDEYFSIILDYVTKEKLIETGKAYSRVIKDFDARIKVLEKRVKRFAGGGESPKYLDAKKKLSDLMQEKSFFVGTVPDPSQIAEGLLLYIDVSTLKDYHVTKDKMQSVMTKFILHLSKIASKEAAFDPDLEYELWKSGKITMSNAQKDEAVFMVDAKALQPIDGDRFELVKDVESGKVYAVNERSLKPVKKSA